MVKWYWIPVSIILFISAYVAIIAYNFGKTGAAESKIKKH